MELGKPITNGLSISICNLAHNPVWEEVNNSVRYLQRLPIQNTLNNTVKVSVIELVYTSVWRQINNPA